MPRDPARPPVVPASRKTLPDMRARESADESRRLVPAVERAARVLDALAASGRPLTAAELARELSLPRSSLHGLLSTLVTLALARRADGGFAIGTRPLRWADAYGAPADVRHAFDTHASQVGALSAETVMLASLEGADVVYLACRPGSRALAVNYRVGGRFPAVFTSSGKAMLSSLSDAGVRERIGPRLPARMTRHSVSSVASLLRQLQTVRQEGHSIDDEETAEGMQCFGAPIFDARGPDAHSAVAVSVIKAGLTARRRAELIAAVRALARSLSGELGAPSLPARPGARSPRP